MCNICTMPVPRPLTVPKRMEARGFVSKNERLEKAVRVMIVKEQVEFRYLNTNIAGLSPHSFVTFLPAELVYTDPPGRSVRFRKLLRADPAK